MQKFGLSTLRNSNRPTNQAQIFNRIFLKLLNCSVAKTFPKPLCPLLWHAIAISFHKNFVLLNHKSIYMI